jgi:hypothetical protein
VMVSSLCDSAIMTSELVRHILRTQRLRWRRGCTWDILPGGMHQQQLLNTISNIQRPYSTYHPTKQILTFPSPGVSVYPQRLSHPYPPPSTSRWPHPHRCHY